MSLYWYEQPTVDRLAPVHPTPLLRHRELMDEVSAGRYASPIYRDPWSRMEVHWALASWGVDGVYLSPDQQVRYRDLAVAAAGLAAQDLFNEYIDQSPELVQLRGLVRTAFAPSLELSRTPHGTRVRANDNSPAARASTNAARFDEPPPRLGPPPPSFRMTSGWALRSADDNDPEAPFWLSWSATLTARNLGVDGARLSVEVVQLGIDASLPSDLAMAWTFSLREQLIDGWYWQAEARSNPGTWDPRYLRGGLSWQFLPVDPRWLVRADCTYGFERPGRPDERRVDLRVMWNGRWVTPAAPDRWPLGEQLDAPGSTWPAHPPAGPNAVSQKVHTPWVVSAE
ncbi:MAG: hypothetical protein H6739_28650 [Alphaproteobacteria bacterium]|nr:hypothetical protein [Alphaproteobacteria bacterium]